MMPERIQLRRVKGWRMPAGAKRVDRATPFGNPFIVGDWVWINPAPRDGDFVFRRTNEQHATDEYEHVATVADAVRLFRTLYAAYGPYAERAREELRGKDLACWCPPGAPCHADVLLEIANERS